MIDDSFPTPYCHEVGGRRSADYNSLLAHLWNAVRRLQARVDDLEKEKKDVP